MSAPPPRAPYSPRDHQRAAPKPFNQQQDDVEVLRSPNAAAGRAATAFTSHDGRDPFATRQRPKPGTLGTSELPSHQSYASSPTSTGSLLPKHGLTVRTTPRPHSGKHGALATPAARKLSYAAVRNTVVVVFLLVVATLALLHGHGRLQDVLDHNIAACMPSYPVVEPRSKRTGPNSQSHPLGELRPSIALVTMHDSRQVKLPNKLAEMTGVPEGPAT